MSNEGHPTQWVSVNPDMGTRDGGEYETTTQSTQDIDALTGHSKPRARRKSWDAGPPTADTDASDKRWDTSQPTADIDAAQTHFTHTHVTNTYTQVARNAAGGIVHSLNDRPPPNPDHPSFPDIPHQGGNACSPCSIGALSLNRNNTQIHRHAVGRHTRVDSGS